MSLFLGLDLSTQSLKATFLDVNSKSIAHEASVGFDDDLPQYGTELGVLAGMPGGVAEAPPHLWRDALVLLLGRISQEVDLSSVRALSVGGQQHGLVALDAGGELSRKTAKLWNDVSTVAEADELERRMGGRAATLAHVANTMRPGYTAPKVLHLKLHEPEVYARTDLFLLPHDYLNYLLAGRAAMEYGDASGTALWDPVRRAWSAVAVEAVGSELWSKLPEVLPPDKPIGKAGTVLARRLGLPQDCLVDAGSGDNMYGAVGTGNVRPGLLTVSLGSSGTAYTVLENPFTDPEGEIACFCDSTGYWLSLVCTSNLAGPYESMLAAFNLEHADMELLSARLQPGEGGRLILPWLQGERTPDVPHGKPLLFGFGPADLTAESLCRPVMDGVLLNLAEGCKRLPVQVGEIRLTGGLSRSRTWRQALADIFNLPVVPLSIEGVSLGAAIHAAWVWHRDQGEPLALAELCAAFVQLEETDRAIPQPETVARYHLLRRCFAALSARARGLPGAEDPFEVARLLE